MRGAPLDNKLEIRKLSFSYNSNKDEQLKDINLDIKDGECCVIIGESMWQVYFDKGYKWINSKFLRRKFRWRSIY